jgi:hypothetical protein
VDSRKVESPWSFIDAASSSIDVVTVAAAKSQNFISPLSYGSVAFPMADTAYPIVMDYADLKVSRVEDVVLLPNHVLIDSVTNSILPYSFMRNRRYHHGGVKLLESGKYKAKYDISLLPELKCDSPLYYADTDHPDVYGHVLLEVLPSFWAKDLVNDRGLKVATSVKMSRGYLSMFEALGVKEDKIVQVKGPTVSPAVYLPSKPIQRRRHIDAMARGVFDRLRHALVSDSDITPQERIYISRSKVAGRKLLNESEVEAMFSALGFTIIHPQELSIFDQVKLFSEAKLIAGSGGSAMHNTLFSNEDCKVLIVSSIGWLVVADALICQKAGQLGYVFGAPAQMPSDTHRTQADWIVDLAEVRIAIKSHFDI